jgi:hypothetical protein
MRAHLHMYLRMHLKSWIWTIFGDGRCRVLGWQKLSWHYQKVSNPTIASYNASVVKIYNPSEVHILVRFEKKNIIFCVEENAPCRYVCMNATAGVVPRCKFISGRVGPWFLPEKKVLYTEINFVRNWEDLHTYGNFSSWVWNFIPRLWLCCKAL